MISKVVDGYPEIKLIDFNVAFQFEGPSCCAKIKGGTGLKEWSAPETRK
jgi:hypothetical protein